MRSILAAQAVAQKQISDIHAVLLGSTEGGRTTTGLVSEVKEHRRFIKFWEKFVWAIIVAGLTIPPGIVLGILVPYLNLKMTKPTPIDDGYFHSRQELIDALKNKG